MTKRELLNRVMQIPGVDDEERAESVITAVFQALRDRLTSDEADDVWAQLPTEWKTMWESGGWWDKITARMKGMNKLNREEFINRVQSHIRNEIPAGEAVRVVFHALKEQITPGETSDVSSQLPEDLRTIWKAA